MLFIVADVRDVQPSNADRLMVVTLAGTVMDESFVQFAKAYSPIRTKDDGSEMVDREVQFAKAPFRMVVMLGREMDVSDVHSPKAPSSITVTLEESVTEVRFSHP